MVQRAFQERDGEGGVRKTLPAGNGVQRSRQLCAGRLEFEQELTQIRVLLFLQAQCAGLFREFH